MTATIACSSPESRTRGSPEISSKTHRRTQDILFRSSSRGQSLAPQATACQMQWTRLTALSSAPRRRQELQALGTREKCVAVAAKLQISESNSDHRQRFWCQWPTCIRDAHNTIGIDQRHTDQTTSIPIAQGANEVHGDCRGGNIDDTKSERRYGRSK